MSNKSIEYEDGKIVRLDEDDSKELTQDFFQNARPGHEMLPPAFIKACNEGRVGRPVSKNPKQSVTVRLDTDVLDWLKTDTQKYQTRINHILRKEMNKSLHVRKYD